MIANGQILNNSVIWRRKKHNPNCCWKIYGSNFLTQKQISSFEIVTNKKMFSFSFSMNLIIGSVEEFTSLSELRWAAKEEN